MTRKQCSITLGIMLISFSISSCSPAATEIPPTKHIESTNTPQPTAAPTETPELPPALTSWNEIPIFPDAISGKEDFGDYQFTTNSPARIIVAYYEQEMVKLGWENRPDMSASPSSDLVFNKGDVFTFFMIKPEGNTNIVYIHPVQN